MAKILIVDDERSLREFLGLMLKREGYGVETAQNAETAKKMIEEQKFDLILTDLKLPGASGLEVLDWAKASDADTQVVVMTAFGTAETAVEAMKLGAYDYILKPFKNEHIVVTIKKALEKGELARENRELKRRIRAVTPEGGIIGRSPKIQEVLNLIERVAKTGVTVHIWGESGTGKELIARRLHELSERKGLFVPVNCSAIPEGLIESELFGHAKGSFTGAVVDKPGLFEEAKNGTLFLDEIAELPLSLQPKLLRTLQEGKIKRVGENRELPFDVRIVSATNRDLLSEVKSGRFREDLYYRLNVVSVKIPRLCERKEDIAVLANGFLEKCKLTFNRNIKGISPQALERLENYDYPGNVRELENIIERAVALETGEQITLASLPEHLREPSHADAPGFAPLGEEGMNLEGLMTEVELHYIREALEKTGGNKTRAAELLGLSFRSFRYRLEKLGFSDD